MGCCGLPAFDWFSLSLLFPLLPWGTVVVVALLLRVTRVSFSDEPASRSHCPVWLQALATVGCVVLVVFVVGVDDGVSLIRVMRWESARWLLFFDPVQSLTKTVENEKVKYFSTRLKNTIAKTNNPSQPAKKRKTFSITCAY